MASTTNSGFESKAESSVRVHEEDGHLQFCMLDVLSSIGNGVRNPQDLGNHSSDTKDTAVKHPRVLIGDVDDERTAVCPKAIRGGDGIALQDVVEVPLGQLGTETKGYVTVHQKLWIGRVNTGGHVQSKHTHCRLLPVHWSTVECLWSVHLR